MGWQAAPISGASRFYALTISGAQGRAVVRGWLEASLADVAAHIAQHFADLELAPVTQAAKGKQLPPALPLNLLLSAVSPPGDSSAPSPLAAELFESALRGTPYRVNLLLRAIERTRAEMGGLASGYQACRRLDARAAMIKAHLNRHKRFHPETTHYQEILPVLDPSNQSPGYLLGQLMAVLERAQQLAMDANATVVDRYFSGASAAPRSAFVRLLKNSHPTFAVRGLCVS
jgi:CRISPR-associated protein Csd1